MTQEELRLAVKSFDIEIHESIRRPNDLMIALIHTKGGFPYCEAFEYKELAREHVGEWADKFVKSSRKAAKRAIESRENRDPSLDSPKGRRAFMLYQTARRGCSVLEWMSPEGDICSPRSVVIFLRNWADEIERHSLEEYPDGLPF
jgi:hypothetical protein